MSEPEYTLPVESGLKKSKFNAAFLQFTRLNELWNDANNHSREGQFDKWNIDLDTIWNELIAHVELKKQTSFDLISRDIKKYQNDPAVLYGLLRKKERMVRKLEDKSGKGTAYQDDDDDGMN